MLYAPDQAVPAFDTDLPAMPISVSFLCLYRVLSVSSLFMLLQPLCIHGIQSLQSIFEVHDQGITARLGEVLAYHDAHHFQVLGVRGHGVCWDYPSTLAELVGTAELA